MVGEEWTDNPAAIAYGQRGAVNRDGYVSDLPSLMDFPLQNALRWGLVTAEGSRNLYPRPMPTTLRRRLLAVLATLRDRGKTEH